MVEWAAANITPTQEESPEKDTNDASSPHGGSDQRRQQGHPKDGPNDWTSPNQTQRLSKRRRRGRRASETPEAALARLTSSYSTAMASVGALHKASASLAKLLRSQSTDSKVDGYDGDLEETYTDIPIIKGSREKKDGEEEDMDRDDPTVDAYRSIERLSKTARDTFEKVVLSDILIKPFAPTFSKVLMGDDWAVQSGEAAATTLNSVAHKATLKELTYASLVNYADLLICGCGLAEFRTDSLGDDAEHRNEKDVLERGAVDVLKVLQSEDVRKRLPSNRHLWKDYESEERSKRLSLVAYCDAADMDGSDPTIWLKLACAARALGKVMKDKQLGHAKVQRPSDMDMDEDADVNMDEISNISIKVGSYVNLSYERLERYALERGLTTLATGIPINRAISRAFRELERKQIELNGESEYQTLVEDKTHDTADLIIDLPRNSWSTLGRFLLRACREGVTSAPDSSQHTGWIISKSWKSSRHNDFGSPTIHIKISPLLTLPRQVLVGVCKYLGSGERGLSSDLKSLESTCRSLSADIVSARASIEKDRNLRIKSIEKEMGDMLKESEQEMKEPAAEETKRDTKDQHMIRSYRSSKRVRSQLISSGKQAERSAKRKSVEYCLVSSIIPCTIDHPLYCGLLSKKNISWNELAPLREYSQCVKTILQAAMPKGGENGYIEACASEISEKIHREKDSDESGLGNTSLTTFIRRWSNANSGAPDMLHRYLVHISCFTENVYNCEKGRMMILSQCISECFDALLKSNVSIDALVPSWYGEDECLPNKHDRYVAIETFAMNLLSTELKMRTCERGTIKVVAFDDDVQTVRTNIPYLLQYSEAISNYEMDLQTRTLVAKLQTRTYWLAGIFYVWWGQNTTYLYDIKEMEAKALGFIDKAIQSLRLPMAKPVMSFSTPHLVSPGRVGKHWLELSSASLTAFRDQIESSTVISRVRQNFCNFLLDIKKEGKSTITDLSDDAMAKLQSIENDLFERYGLRDELPGQNFDELINDFMVRHGLAFAETNTEDTTIEQSDGNDDNHPRWSSVWHLIPFAPATLQVDHVVSPSLLMFVVTCYCAKRDGYFQNIGSLLSRLIITILDKRNKILDRKETSNIDMAFDDSDSSSDEASIDEHDNSSYARDPMILMKFAHFLLAKLSDVIEACDPADIAAFQIEFVGALKSTMESALDIASDQDDRPHRFVHLQPDLNVFMASLHSASKLLQVLEKESDEYAKLLLTLFSIFVRVIIHGKKNMLHLLSSKSKDHIGRSQCHGLVILHAKYIGIVASEMASMLSYQRNRYLSGGTIEESPLVRNLIRPQGSVNGKEEISHLIQLGESLSWLWEFVRSVESIGTSTPARYSTVTNTVHKNASTYLVVPIAGAIVGLCGSVGHGPGSVISQIFTNEQNYEASTNADVLSLSDYFDSDDSAREWMSEDEGDPAKVNKSTRRRLLQTLNRTVQCIGLVFSAHEDRELSQDMQCIISPITGGCFLPLIVARVLTSISDYIFTEFSERGDKPSSGKGVWEEEYPFGFRSAGAQLDLLLHRAYRCLHGINIVSPHLHLIVGKDASLPSDATKPTDDIKYFLPESTEAALQLYRCIKRAYYNGRRSIPSEAFDCVLSALPVAKESTRVKAIKALIFNRKGDETTFSTAKETPIKIISPPGIVNDLPPEFPMGLFDYTPKNETVSLDDDIQIARRGIWENLSEGPIPSIASSSDSLNSGNSTGAGHHSDDRKAAAKTEIALSKMLSSVINALHFDPLDENKWYRAGLCIGGKLNIILDRLLLAERGYKPDRFFLPRFKSLEERDERWRKEGGRCCDVAKLIKRQRHTFKKQFCHGQHILGNDLSIYMDYQWSSPESLRSLQNLLLNSCLFCDEPSAQNILSEKDKAHLVGLRLKIETGDIAEWQNLWGINFATALQLMRHRCFRIAMCLAKKRELDSGLEDSIYSTVAEASGTAHYDAIGSSTATQTKFETRKRAQLAKTYFESALESLCSSADSEENEKFLATWELNEMIGKCYEKIAFTLTEERYETYSPHQHKTGRLYEDLMIKSLNCYSLSLMEAKAFVAEGSSLEFQGGGSSHGLIELIYRLHASRFKVLLTAAKTPKEDRKVAISEAVRIAEKYWFAKPEDISEANPVDKMWIILCDIVDGLAYCRKEQPFFHRSVFRHAQALMWAPLFNDPEGALEGSMCSLPAHKGHQIRGSDGGPCAKSAESIISALFDKKRPQLVAVWVTTPSSPTPFETINASGRKFDKLRCKYTGAFIESMHLCKKREPLETLLKWCYAVPRDLPNFYASSVVENDSSSRQYHTRDSLLSKGCGLFFFAKKYANTAICTALIESLLKFDPVHCTSNERNDAVDQFGEIYKCFFRLNCPAEDALWQTHKMKRAFQAGLIPEADALCRAYRCIITKDSNSVGHTTDLCWEKNIVTLRAASKKGSEMFPSIAAELSVLRKGRKKRKSNEVKSPIENETRLSSQTDVQMDSQAEGST